MNQLALFLQYSVKVYELNRHLRGLRDHRPYPVIPTKLFLTLFLGAVLRVGSYHALSAQTQRRRWRHLIHWNATISHDSLEYVAERFFLEDLRALLASINKQQGEQSLGEVQD